MAAVANPEMVTLVRNARGWSQADLARESNLSQPFISRVENRKAELEGAELGAVAAALECPVDLLIEAVPSEDVPCLHNRRRSSLMTVASQRRIEALTHLTRLTVDGLTKAVKLQDGLPFERSSSATSPQDAARRLRQTWQLPSGPIADLTRTIEAAGVVVVTRSLGSAAQDAVSTWAANSDSRPLIVVSDALPGDRLRFTLAHELGHLHLHAFRGEGQEEEADAFASEFLAPAADIEQDLAGLTVKDFPRLMELKAKWGISIAALIRRAKDLGIVSERQYRSFNIRLNQLGWRKFEPVSLPSEQPSTVRRVITIHQQQAGRGLDEVAQMAGMTPSAFASHYLSASETKPLTLSLEQDV